MYVGWVIEVVGIVGIFYVVEGYLKFVVYCLIIDVYYVVVQLVVQCCGVCYVMVVYGGSQVIGVVIDQCDGLVFIVEDGNWCYGVE